MRPSSIALSVSIAALAAQSLGLATPALAATASPVDVPFAYTGAEQSWHVPTGVTTIHVKLVGGRGGGFGGIAGGFGAIVEGDRQVTAGATLYVEVGGNGSLANQPGAGGGFNGGGAGGQAGPIWGYGGGGASDLRTISRSAPNTVDSQIVIAGGGGGTAADHPGGTQGAAGGDAGSPGASAPNGGGGGGAGTQSAGGAGGAGTTAALNGADGVDTFGGAGGSYSQTGTGAGGGGGGGNFGGGGGGARSLGGDGGGGGGGSNLTIGLSNLSESIDSTGVASVTITYTPPADNGTVDVHFSVPTSAACLELSTSSVDFGSVHLGSENTAATPDITVTSCSGTPEDLFAHGSDATATGVTWSLVGGSATCADTLGTDNYRMSLESTAGTVGLSTTNAALGTLAAGDTSTQTARIFAACPGSSGAGQLMTTQITFLAVEGG